MSSGALFATSAMSAAPGTGLAVPRSIRSVAGNAGFNSGGVTRRPMRLTRPSLYRAPRTARPSAAAAAFAPLVNRRRSDALDLAVNRRVRPTTTRGFMVPSAAGKDIDDIDDDELAALEALDEVNGWEDDDDEAMAVAAAVAARAVGSADDLSDLEALGDDDELDEGSGDEEGVALLRELFEYGGVEVQEWVNLGDDEDIEVSGIANDSRAVLGGDVFVCCVGTESDGHAYALDAVAAGAALCL